MFSHSPKMFFLFFFIVKNTFEVNGDVFSAIADMEDLVLTEEIHIESLQSFIRYQEQLIAMLKK